MVEFFKFLFNSCIFESNKHGAISVYDYFAESDILIENSIFKNNIKSGYGSAICVGGKYTVNIVNTTFLNNYASDGGAVYAFSNPKNIIIDSSKFINNTALYDGSAVKEYGGANTTITNSLFENNTANSSLIYYDQPNSNKLYLNMANNTIKNNNPDTIYTSGNVQIIDLNSNTCLSAHDVSITEGMDVNFTVTLTDRDGNPLANKTVFINLTDFEGITDASGQVSFSLKNQNPGKYNVLSYFTGDGIYTSSNITSTVLIQSQTDYNIVFNPDYVKLLEGNSFIVNASIYDSYFQPDDSFDGCNFEIRWVNHKGTISVIEGSYSVDGNKFSYDLSRCHLTTRNELYYINFTVTSNYYGSVTGTLPVDTSSDMPPVDSNIEVIYVSVDGSDETGDGTKSNPLRTPQMALYLNKVLGGSKTIHIGEGVYNISIYNILDDVEIVGEGSKTVLRQESGRLGMFYVQEESTLKLANLSFTNGFATPVPSSLITVTEFSTVYIEGCEFYDNHAIRGGSYINR